MARNGRGKSVLIVASLCSVFACVAPTQDPPSRVARLNYIAGNVSMQLAGMDEWSPAMINRPVITGDNLWADVDESRSGSHKAN
jgi:hypothetical protein